MELVHGGPTKSEIASIALSKLQLFRDAVLADIGCGTGFVSILAAPRVRRVYSIDGSEDAITAARINATGADIDNMELIQAEAPAVLDQLPTLDCAFVGGTRNIDRTLQVLQNKVRGRIVVNVVRIQTAASVIETMQQMDIFQEAIHVQVSKSYALAGQVAFKPLNPVYIIVGDTRINNNREAA